MTPRRFAIFILALLLPAMLWAFAENGKNDLLLKTRSLMGQAKKDRPGVRDSFIMQFRLPLGEPFERDAVLERLWETFRGCTPDQAVYATREPLRLEDNRHHERRQVLVRGKSPAGEPVEVRVDWVRFSGEWYIHGFTGWEPTPNPRHTGRALAN